MHVNNATYQEYFDFGKLEYFNQVLGYDVDWDKTGLVLAKITIDYLLPIELNEEIIVFSKIIRIGNKSLDIYQEIKSKRSSMVKATAVSTMVGFSKTENVSIRIPESWREKISRFEKGSK